MDWECCWYKESIEMGDCPYISDGEEGLLTSLKRRVLEKCVDCPRFRNDIQKLREINHPLADVLPFVIAEFQGQKSQLQTLAGFLDSRNREIQFLHEISSVLQTSMDLDEVLSVAMTAITAGKGFGMNRAFLLLTDKDRTRLEGYLGVGPRNYEEAWRTWENISRDDFSLRDLSKNFHRNKLSEERIKFNDILAKLTVSLDDEDHILVRALEDKTPILVEDAFHNQDVPHSLAHALGVDTFLITPLVSINRRIGIIITDNCITHKPISKQDMQSMETFALPVAFAIVRASLYERLHEELENVKTANAKLREQQELIVKMEKMALVGKITSSIAHSIRNPLMIIGGFTRSLLRSSPPDDPKKHYIESIVRETRQLEEVLDDVLNYSDSLYPSMDMWDISQLVTSVYREMQETFELRGVSFSHHTVPDLPPACIDYKQVAYCVRSILNTALEGMAPNGQIAISERLEGNRIALEIRDNGDPMTQEQLEALTTPFNTTHDMGRAMGLALCKTIFEKSGTTFTIESPLGGGMKYSIWLPVNKEDNTNG